MAATVLHPMRNRQNACCPFCNLLSLHKVSCSLIHITFMNHLLDTCCKIANEKPKCARTSCCNYAPSLLMPQN